MEDAEENLTNDVVTVTISLQSWTQCRTSQTNHTIFSLQMFFMSNNFHRPRHTGALHLQLKVNEREKNTQIKEILALIQLSRKDSITGFS